MLQLNELPAPLTGEALKQSISDKRTERQPYIEGLLYERSIIMLHSAPGVGKSVITAQLAAHLSNATPAFGFMIIPKPRRVYYVQLERDSEETLDRWHHMQKEITFNFDNLCLDDALKGINLIDTKHIELLISRLDKFKPEVIIFDPIYAGVAGGLSKDEPASQFCRFIGFIQYRYQCAIWLNHHSHRQQYHAGKAVEEADSFYGSQWLKALVTGSYEITLTETGSILKRKKDSHGNLLSKVVLTFDEETYLSSSSFTQTDLSAPERLLAFLEAKKGIKNFHTFDEISSEIKVSHAHLRRLIMRHPFLTLLIKTKSNGKKTLYHYAPKNVELSPVSCI